MTDSSKRLMTCIVCPKGCSLEIDESTRQVTGNGCRRGEEYAINELLHPVRVLTTAIRIRGIEGEMLPVRTKTAIPKELLFDAMKAANQTEAILPVTVGDVILPNLLGTGVDLVASRSMDSPK